MIDLTPLEVRKKKGDFRRALRGYEPALVDDFLDIAADRLEQLVRENAGLVERVGRLEQQVAEYRDRERALTDALVTAQAMREEITERTTREAEAVRVSAQQEAEAQLKGAAQQADSTVRDAEQRAGERLRRAQEEADTALQRAEREASTRLQAAEEEATTRLREAEQEAHRLRSEAARIREHEEAALQRLRARQQQLVLSYRSFLQRELGELNAIAESLEPAAEAAPADLAPAPGPPAPTAASAAALAAAAAASPPAAASSERTPGADRVQPGTAPEAEPELEPEPAPEALPSPWAAAPAGAMAIPEADEEEEPFAPEPVYEEDLAGDESLRRLEPTELLRAPAPEVAEESGEAVEEEWPDLDILPEGQEPDFTRPQPNPEALRLPWTEEAAAELAAETEPEADTAEEDPETDALLQNAARAGYRLELDDEPELLLDEPATDEESSDDWLDSIIEEDR